ncbi:MAG: DNA-processing protein DprA, partial [Spirochaetales bacterium]|nr:DNA-processing protein DprA [Spirochaetales bacterium]
RNRIISGLSRSVVVVEAPEKSGALITADFALDQGRDVFVHSCSLSSKKGLGCQKLVASGAAVINSAEEIISLREAV